MVTIRLWARERSHFPGIVVEIGERRCLVVFCSGDSWIAKLDGVDRYHGWVEV